MYRVNTRNGVRTFAFMYMVRQKSSATARIRIRLSQQGPAVADSPELSGVVVNATPKANAMIPAKTIWGKIVTAPRLTFDQKSLPISGSDPVSDASIGDKSPFELEVILLAIRDLNVPWESFGKPELAIEDVLISLP